MGEFQYSPLENQTTVLSKESLIGYFYAGGIVMKAAVLEVYHQPLMIRDVEISEPGPDEVTLEVKAVSLCLSDVHISEGKVPTVKLPHVPGHEFSGVVAKTGSGVNDFKPGDRVSVNLDVICGRCDHCLRGDTNRCSNLIRIGFERNGAMAEYVNVPARNLEKISEHVSFEKAAILPDAVATSYGPSRPSAASLPEREWRSWASGVWACRVS